MPGQVHLTGMNNMYPPQRPQPPRFHEEWLLAVLTLVAICTIFFSLKESGGIASASSLSSALVPHPVEALTTPPDDSTNRSIRPVDILSKPGVPQLRMSSPL